MVVNFVDDSNSVISAKPGEDLEQYVNSYFKLLEIYYNSKKLKVNKNKTQILVCSMPRFLNQIIEMEIKTPPDINNVKPQEQIKVLVYLFNGRGNIDNQVNATGSTIGGLFHIAYKYRKIMP